MTKNELKDAALFLLSFYFLKTDSNDDLGLFINEKASKHIHDLISSMQPVIEYYKPYENRVNTIIDSLMNRSQAIKDDFSVTAIQVACDLLYLGFAPNERKNKKLSPIIADYYEANKDKIIYILNLAYDTKYEQQAIDSQRLVYFYLENL